MEPSDKSRDPETKQSKSIRHQCYFSPIQCLLALPEDKMRTIVKTHNGPSMESRTFAPVVRSSYRAINPKFRQHDDFLERFGNGLTFLSSWINFDFCWWTFFLTFNWNEGHLWIQLKSQKNYLGIHIICLLMTGKLYGRIIHEEIAG